MNVSFDITVDESNVIAKIAKRAANILRERGNKRHIADLILEIKMDLTAAHANGCPLDFHKLFAADDFNLMHDVVGINNHLNRETGRLENHFLLRFAARKSV